MKSNLQINNKKDNKKIELNKIQKIALLSQLLLIFAIIVSFIMSRYVIELTLLMNTYLVILAFVMAYTNYTIYKRKSISIIYLILGAVILVDILLGIFG